MVCNFIPWRIGYLVCPYDHLEWATQGSVFLEPLSISYMCLKLMHVAGSWAGPHT
jgi:hypothetical protein